LPFKREYGCPRNIYSDGNVRWPRRMLTLVSHAEYVSWAPLQLEKDAERPINVRKKTEHTDGRTDARPKLTFSATDAASVTIKTA